MAERSLHDLVVAYKSGVTEREACREAIMERVASMIYRSHAAYGFDDEDAAADALLKYRDRLSKLVDRFQDRGLPFDAYLATSLRFLARTVRRDKRRDAERELICERAASDDSPASWQGAGEELMGEDFDASPPAFEPGTCPPLRAVSSPALARGSSPSASKRRPRAKGGCLPRAASVAARSSRLVFLAVKCAWELDDESVARIADSAGVSPDWLAQAVGQARRSLEPERSRRERLVERRNSAWCRRRLLESRLEKETDPERRERMAFSLERESRRFRKAVDELAAMRPIVPNSVVARILGVPKGTVDSGLYYLRRRQQGGPAR